MTKMHCKFKSKLCTVLLDNGSPRPFLTKDFATKMNLSIIRKKLSIYPFFCKETPKKSIILWNLHLVMLMTLKNI